jgi:hypothetical protein
MARDGLGPRLERPGLGRDLPRPILLIRLAIRARMPERTILTSPFCGHSYQPQPRPMGRDDGTLTDHGHISTHSARSILPVKAMPWDDPEKHNYFYISIANTTTN